MGLEFQEILFSLAAELRGTTKMVEGAIARMEILAKEHGDMRERLASLERGSELGEEHGNEEHRRLRKRLEDGDAQFKALQKESDAAKKAAESAKHSLAEIQKALEEARRKGDRVTSSRTWQRRLLDKAVEAVVPIAVSGIFWFLYHLWVAAKLAEASLKAGGVH